jgi:peptidoglycan/xylan/chitin deacetylase (PgdA/CDA1 family)
MDLQPLKSIWSAAADRLGVYDRRLRRAAPARPWFIPVYHRILEDDEIEPFGFGLGVHRRRFAAHLAYYLQAFHVCTVEAALALIAEARWPDRPLLSITFDDGYRDNAELALPALQAAGCPATFFICTGPLEDDRPFWWDLAIASALQPAGAHWQALRAALGVAPGAGPRAELVAVLDRLWQKPYAEIAALLALNRPDRHGLAARCPKRMRPDQVRALAAAGMEIAAHTHHHPNLTREEPAAVAEELARSKALLERWTGRRVTGFAAPNGFIDQTVRAACGSTGLAYLASTEKGINRAADPLHLERFGAPDAPVAQLKRSLAAVARAGGAVAARPA